MSNKIIDNEFFLDKQTLLNYEFKQSIGQGTFGKVKLAIHSLRKENVAVKILNKKQIEKKNEMNLVQRELDIIPNFNHINLIKVHHILQDENNFYIVMDYCENGELFDYIVKKHRLSEEESSNFFYQLINGVEYIHNCKIVHRDLKPENLLLTKNKTLTIIDFGLSSEFDGKNLLSTKCGSPSYAAPEIIKGYQYNGFKTDIWCCGIILYAMICGYLPFEGDNNKELFKNILEGQIDFPNYVSSAARSLILKILTSDPDERIDIEGIKQSEFYLKGKELCKINYNQKRKRKYPNIANTNEDVELIFFKKRLLQLNSNFNKKVENINNQISQILKTNIMNMSNNKMKLQSNKIKNGKVNYSHIITTPISTPTTTVSNVEIPKKRNKIKHKFTLHSLIDTKKVIKHSILRINGEQYIYKPSHFTNRFNSPPTRMQVSTQIVTNRNQLKNYYVLPTEKTESAKISMIQLNKNDFKNVGLSICKSSNGTNCVKLSRRSPGNSMLPRLI